MRKLPIGIQTFKDIRVNDYVYIDKTPEALKLLDSGHKYFFLSRPRRFGKSLFLDTLHNVFEGNRELFKGLHIYDKYDWNQKYPVIKISFSGDLRSETGIRSTIFELLRYNSERLQVDCTDINDIGVCFKELIRKSSQKYNQKVVVLIDEYDKAILDNLDQLDMAYKAREIIKSLYSILKDSDAYLRFAFLTGVSKFAKASIFSGLNNLYDISLDTDYSCICGYKQSDLETSFKEHLANADMDGIKRWYNGYSWLGEPLYNPFDILLFIQNKCEFKNYWFETGTPTFLVKLMKEKRYFLPNLSNLEAGDSLINSFDIEDLDLEAILFQAGYLTIKEKYKLGVITMYRLKVPNLEVQISLNDHLLNMMESDHQNKIKSQSSIYQSLLSQNLESLKKSLISLYASISHHNFTKNQIDEYEGFYASVIYAYFASLGVELISEDITNKGRIDMTIKMDDAIYIFEFKVIANETKQSSNIALNQIKERNYQQKYLDSNLPIYLIGIEFDSKERNITKMEWERV